MVKLQYVSFAYITVSTFQRSVMVSQHVFSYSDSELPTNLVYLNTAFKIQKLCFSLLSAQDEPR